MHFFCFVAIFCLQLKDMPGTALLEALDLPEHKALSTTIDNAGTYETAGETTTILNNTASYYVLGRTADALEQ